MESESENNLDIEVKHFLSLIVFDSKASSFNQAVIDEERLELIICETFLLSKKISSNDFQMNTPILFLTK